MTVCTADYGTFSRRKFVGVFITFGSKNWYFVSVKELTNMRHECDQLTFQSTSSPGFKKHLRVHKCFFFLEHQ